MTLAALAERALPRDPQAADQPVLGRRGAACALPLTSLIEEVIAPHRDFGITITARAGRAQRSRAGRPAQSGRHLRARQSGRERRRFRPRIERHVHWRWNDERVAFTIVDDGPGFPAEIIDRIGEPYMSTRQGTEHGGGLGLGLFIAKTLLERSGATLSFRNSSGSRARARWSRSCWPRAAFLRLGRRRNDLRHAYGRIARGIRLTSASSPKLRHIGQAWRFVYLA